MHGAAWRFREPLHISQLHRERYFTGHPSSGLWMTEMPKRDLYLAYIDWCQITKKPHPASDRVFGKELIKAIDVQIKRQGDKDRTRVYTLPDLETCRVQFKERIAHVGFDDMSYVTLFFQKLKIYRNYIGLCV